MAKKRAFVRYADNKAVSGSLIVRTEAPSVGVWKEVPYNLCCQPATPSCVIMQGVPEIGEGGYAYGFSLDTFDVSGAYLRGTVEWEPGQVETINILADGSTYDFQHIYANDAPKTVRLCISNPTLLQDFELGFGPGDTVSLDNAQALKGVDEWDSDDMQIYSLDLSGMVGLRQLYHCCSVLTHINITGSVDLIDVVLNSNALTQASVDHVLITLDGSGLSNGNVDLGGGTSAAPSVAGTAAAVSLAGKGWNVNTN